MSLIESLTISIPVLKIIIDTNTPTYASKLIFHTKYIIPEAKTEIDTIASFNASTPLAINVSEFTNLPFFFTYIPSNNLTKIPETITIIVNLL